MKNQCEDKRKFRRLLRRQREQDHESQPSMGKS
jgi:hypothetical protein